MRYKMTLAYNGKAYSGFQVQDQKHTIQHVIESALHKILGESLRIIPGGRTDKGVHALKQTLHFDLKTEKSKSRIQHRDILYQLNSVLPEDLLVTELKKQSAKFHSRTFKQKTYRYHILISRYSNPFLKDYTWMLPKPLNITAMKNAAKLLTGKHDFTSFCASDSSAKTKIRNLLDIKIHTKSPAAFFSFKHEHYITLDFTGTGFLKQMVRNLVGTLVAVGQDKIKAGDVKKILDAKDRKKAAQTAPAQGLFLVTTKY